MENFEGFFAAQRTEEAIFTRQSLGSMSDADFKRLAFFVKKKYGLDLFGKKSMVESRLYHYVIDRGFSSFEDYFRTVYDSENSDEMPNIINRLTTNYTYFLREQEHFKHFMTKFLPQAQSEKGREELRIWSAGCSFGNEAYSFAACMEEFFSERKTTIADRRILATDISRDALIAAKKGMYSKDAVKCLPEEWVEKYFTVTGGFYTVNERLRSQVVFRCHNLMDRISFKKKFDLIICRNVMIYFDKKTKSDLIKRFYDATVDGGYLYIGHAEAMPEELPYVREAAAVYRKEVSAK